MWAMMIFFVLFILSHIQAKKNEDFHPKAEYLITLTWDDKRNVDLDLWLRGPWGPNPVYYNGREGSQVALDRDSRGFLTNKKVLDDGTEINSGNREIIAIRAILPGDYEVGVSYYGGADNENHNYPEGTPVAEAKIMAEVRVEKVNPTMTTEWVKSQEFTFVKEIQTFVKFHIDKDGKVTILDKPTEPFLPNGLTGNVNR